MSFFTSDFTSFFSEVRLQAGASCRAWMATHGCFSSVEWEQAFPHLPGFRPIVEEARLRISDALSVEGIDPMGIVRRLLIHESAAPLSRSALRAFGFVHLESASGLHLYALARAYDRALAWVSERAGWRPKWVAALRILGPLSIAFSAFVLMGFRAGFWRPFILVMLREFAVRRGIRFARAAPIGIALGSDVLIGFFSSFGESARFVDWAPGELHYALAWWGGILGYEWARARGSNSFIAHVALSFGSWLVVLPLDFTSGSFAPGTPLFSLITVEVLTRGGYLLLIGSAIAMAFEVSWATDALQALSLAVSHGVAALFGLGVRSNLGREVEGEYGLFWAVLLSVGVLAGVLHTGVLKKPLKTRV